WIGRYLDNACGGLPDDSDDPVAIHLGNEVPQSFSGASPHSTFGLTRGGGGRGSHDLLKKLVNRHDDDHDHGNEGFLRSTMMDALVTEQRVQKILGQYRPETAYPGGGFAQSLRNVAALIAAGLSTRVYFVSLGGFDTHANQINNHQRLLHTLSVGIAAFHKQLDAKGHDPHEHSITYSEYG